jgi:hypothetical protein
VLLLISYKHTAYLKNFVVLIFYFSCFFLSLTSPSEQTMSAKKMEDKLSRAVEIFTGRIQKMENEFIRYEERALVLIEITLLFLLNLRYLWQKVLR